MKQELINKITPNCLLPFSFMVLWIDNLAFLNDSNGALKLEVKNKIRSDGRLEQDGWDILIHNVVFETGAPVNGNTILNWIMLQGSPTCNQFKIIIQSIKMGTLAQLYVTMPVLDAIEVDMKVSIHDSDNGTGGRNISWVSRDPNDDNTLPSVGYEFKIKFFQLFIKNFDYIKNCNPYLVIERYSGAKKIKNRKGGWKRDKVLKKLGGIMPLWAGGHKNITYNNGYRPNEIPITSAQQEFNIYPENYIRIWGGENLPPKKVGQNSKRNVIRVGNMKRAKISIRLRIGIIVGGEEILSKPTNYFSIFATELSTSISDPHVIEVGYSKI